MPTPAPPVCLTRAYSATPDQRGGTLIAEDVVDRAEHRRRLSELDGYRPPCCFNCDCERLDAHDFRERGLRGEGERETFRRYICVECRAVWLVLAGFMARHLHRSWQFVESSTGEAKAAARVSRRTLRRWQRRLRSSSASVVQAMVASGVELGRASESRSRAEVLAAMVREGLLRVGRAMAELAGWLHRLVPGLRLL